MYILCTGTICLPVAPVQSYAAKHEIEQLEIAQPSTIVASFAQCCFVRIYNPEHSWNDVAIFLAASNGDFGIMCFSKVHVILPL